MDKSEFLWRLNNKLPGQKVKESKLDPPEASIYFSKINKKSLSEFNNYSLNPKLYEFFEFKPFKSMKDTLDYYEKMQKRIREETHYYWFVRRKKDDKLIGSASLASINFERKSVEWGYGIDPEYWGLNYNLQINEHLKHYIFDVLSMNRLFGVTMVSNKKAIECVKASGCVLEGILREFYKKDDIFIDGWMYSILAKDYYEESIEKIKPKEEISLQEIISLISEIITEENLDELTSMNNCINWDSMSHTSIITTISEKYKVKLTPTDFTKLTSVKLIHNFLNN